MENMEGAQLDLCDCSRRCVYRDFKVFEVIPLNNEQLNLIEMFRKNSNIDFWSARTSIADPIHILISSVFQNEFKTVLEKNSIEHKIIINDVEMLLENKKLQQASLPNLINGKLNLQKYHRYAMIQHHLNQLLEKYPNLIRLENYGLSTERRNLTFVHISKKSDKTKPAIFLDAGIHAREWIAPAFALYVIDQLLEIPTNSKLVENVDWFVVPLVNPDGYEFTHTTERFWRKTRSKGLIDYGVDPNRNFDFQWMTGGSTSDELSNNYAGPKPFSEPETFSLSKLIKTHAKQIKVYLTVHSAAQCVLHPWGFTRELPDDVLELRDLAVVVRGAIQAVNGTVYRIGNSSGILTLASGSSSDWAKGVAGIKWSYVLELPGGGDQGFDLPSNRILNVSKEAFEGVKAFHGHIENLYVK